MKTQKESRLGDLAKLPFWRQTWATARDKKPSINALPKISALWDKCILYNPKIFGDLFGL